jgi:uncharacterized protein related to proFAR isomerase
MFILDWEDRIAVHGISDARTAWSPSRDTTQLEQKPSHILKSQRDVHIVLNLLEL